MSKNRGRTVYKRDDGRWANARVDASRPSSLHGTQREAVAEAKRMLTSTGGGELTVMGIDGKVRSKDTIGGDGARAKKG